MFSKKCLSVTGKSCKNTQWRNNVVKSPWRKQIKGPYFAITVLEGEGKNVAKIRQIIASIILDRDFIILA